MRIVFMGTPVFAARILEALMASKHQVVGVVTRPDAVRGRGKKLIASPVKECACANQITVLEYGSLRSDEAYEQVAALRPDVICVAAYGAILPRRILILPEHGCLNVHASLLPRWRGAAPIERAILAGDPETGIGIMHMEEGLDTGAVAEQRATPIGHKTSDELTEELAQLGGEALVKVLDALDAGSPVTWHEQGAQGITYADKIAKGELDVSPWLETDVLLRRVQAAGSSHPCRCVIAGKPLSLLRAAAVSIDEVPGSLLEPGQVCFAAKRLFLGCTEGVVEVISVKPDGKKAMAASAFAAGIQGIKQLGSMWQGIHEKEE